MQSLTLLLCQAYLIIIILIMIMIIIIIIMIIIIIIITIIITIIIIQTFQLFRFERGLPIRCVTSHSPHFHQILPIYHEILKTREKIANL